MGYSKKLIEDLIYRYFNQSMKDEDICLYLEVCKEVQKIVINFKEYEDYYKVYHQGEKVLISVLETDYDLGIKMELCHKNVESIHYKVSEVVMYKDDIETILKDNDGFIEVYTETEGKFEVV